MSVRRSEFQELRDEAFQRIRDLNDTKGSDYAGDEDALSNFKRHAERLGLTPELVWAVYAGKHWDAIETYCRTGEVKSEAIEGRVYDLVLYSLLLLGLVREREALTITA
jgi:hypothetical protein